MLKRTLLLIAILALLVYLRASGSFKVSVKPGTMPDPLKPDTDEKPEPRVKRSKTSQLFDDHVINITINNQTSGATASESGRDGKDGRDGSTPYIGENGNWWIDGTDTGHPVTAQPEQGGAVTGVIPYIGPNGNWWIAETDTGKPSRGENGRDGKDGSNGTPGKDGATPYIQNGYWYINGQNTGIAATANTGTGGRDGATPYISGGYWFINGQSTGVKATGEKGEKGDKGDTGAKGLDGFTPYIQSGYWFINGKNTGQKATGENGLTPYISSDYWMIGDENTGVKATGTPGAKGDKGLDGFTPYIQSGYWYVNGKNTGVKATGENGITPHISSGYWYVGAQNTGVVATGPKGAQGAQGAPGVCPTCATLTGTDGTRRDPEPAISTPTNNPLPTGTVGICGENPSLFPLKQGQANNYIEYAKGLLTILFPKYFESCWYWKNLNPVLFDLEMFNCLRAELGVTEISAQLWCSYFAPYRKPLTQAEILQAIPMKSTIQIDNRACTERSSYDSEYEGAAFGDLMSGSPIQELGWSSSNNGTSNPMGAMIASPRYTTPAYHTASDLQQLYKGGTL
jgi:hypothetical protein